MTASLNSGKYYSHAPYDPVVYALILVSKEIPDCRDFGPMDRRVARFEIVRKVSAGLRDDLHAPLDGLPRCVASLILNETHAGYDIGGAIYRLKHVGQPHANRPLRHSKYPDAGPLDLLLEHGMQARTGREINVAL